MAKSNGKPVEPIIQKTTGKTFWDLLENLFTGKPLIVWLTILGIVVLVLVLILTGLLHLEIKEGKVSMSFNQIQNKSTTQQISQDSLTTFCVVKGIELEEVCS